jgi:hypothetical protein
MDFNSNENWPRQRAFNIDYQAKAKGYAAFWDGQPRKNPYHSSHTDSGVPLDAILSMLHRSWDMGWRQGEEENRASFRDPIDCLTHTHKSQGITGQEFADKVKDCSINEIGTIKVSDFVNIKPGPLSSVHFGTSLFKDGQPIGKILSVTKDSDNTLRAKVNIDPARNVDTKEHQFFGTVEGFAEEAKRMDIGRATMDAIKAFSKTANVPINKLLGPIDIQLSPSVESLVEIDRISKELSENMDYAWSTAIDNMNDRHKKLVESAVYAHRQPFYVEHLDAAIKGAHAAVHHAGRDGSGLNPDAHLAYNDAYDMVYWAESLPEEARKSAMLSIKKYCCIGDSSHRQKFITLLNDHAAHQFIQSRKQK